MDSMMTIKDKGFVIIDWISILITVVPLIFVIWFAIKFLSIHKERNKILKEISNKLDK